MSYAVEFSRAARDDLDRLTVAILDRELASHTPDLSLPDKALASIRSAVGLLAQFPFSCRKAGDGKDPFLRELVISFGRSGFVLLFKIMPDHRIVVAAVRHQLESDFH